MPYTRICNCLLDCDYVLHIVTFAILYFKNNGTVYREKVLVPRAEDVLRCDNEEIDRLEGIKVTFSDEKRERGNSFVASDIYKKICSLPSFTDFMIGMVSLLKGLWMMANLEPGETCSNILSNVDTVTLRVW